MEDYTGYPLNEAIKEIFQNKNYIIQIQKVMNVYKRNIMLTNPYIVRFERLDKYFKLYVSYY